MRLTVLLRSPSQSPPTETTIAESAIGYLEKTLLSIIYEIRYDEEGEYIWLITYWDSTKREREIYEQYLN